MRSRGFELGIDGKVERKWKNIELMGMIHKVSDESNMLGPCVVVIAKDEKREAQ